jgi:acetoin utilization deacetylase AcuC-like enzyme
MIVYSKCSWLNLPEFGIQVPLRDNRVERILEHLNTILGDRISQFVQELPCKPVSKRDLARVHSNEYLERILSDEPDEEIIRIYELRDAEGNWTRFNPDQQKLPFTELVNKLLGQVNVVIHASELALHRGWCYVLGGGAHHAMRDHGAGFCLVNDIVIAIRRLQALGRIVSAWVIDTDAHKGDGTAALTAGNSSIKTLSIHMAQGWPLDDPQRRESFIPSDFDIPIAQGEEEFYNIQLELGLKNLIASGKADFAVVVAGSDPYLEDELESTEELRLTLEQMLQRDRLVFTTLKDLKIPQLWLMAGGYGDQVWKVHAYFLEWLLSSGGG